MAKKWMKMLAVLCGALFLFAAVAGCTGGEDEYAGKTRLIVWTADPIDANYTTTLNVNPDDPKALFTKKLVEDFEGAHENVKLQLVFQDWGETLNQNLLAAFARKTKMDVVPGEAYIRSYIEAGRFAPIELDENIRLSEKATGNAMKDGELYAVPVFTGTFSLIINTQVLKEAGILNDDGTPKQEWTDKDIDPLAPKYWEDLLEVSKAVKQYFVSQDEGDGRGGCLIDLVEDGSQWRALAYMAPAGGDYLDDAGDFILNDEKNVKAFDMMRQLGETAPDNSLGINDENTLFRYLTNGNAAYIVEGISPFTVTATDAQRKNLITVELPTFKTGGVKANVMCGTVYYSIVESSENKDLAQDFIELLLTEEYQKLMMEIDYRVPTNSAVFESEEIQTEQYHWSIMEPYCKPFSDESYTVVPGVPGFNNNQANIWSTWNSFLRNAVRSANDIAAVRDYANAANTQINEVKDR